MPAAGGLLVLLVAAVPATAQRIAPLPQRLTSVPSRIYEPAEAPATDPFGYPRNDIDKTHLTALLAAARYDDLEAELRALHEAVRADIRHEQRLSTAYHAFQRADVELGALLDAWVTVHPTSVEAHLARARHRIARARDLRGRNLLLETRPDQIAGAREFAELASEDLDIIFAAAPGHLTAYQTALDLMQLRGWSADMAAVLDRGLEYHPWSATLWAAALAGAAPATGGRFALMDSLADVAAAGADANPRLAVFRGSAAAERGRLALRQRNLAGAVHWYGLALEHGPDAAFLAGRGAAWIAARDYTRGLVDLLDASAQTPQNPDVLQGRAEGLLEIAQFAPPDIRDEVLERAFEAVTMLKAVDPGRPDVDRLVTLITAVRAGCLARSPQCRGAGGT